MGWLRRILGALIGFELLVAGAAVDVRTGDADVVIGQPPAMVTSPLPGPTVVIASPQRPASASVARRSRPLGSPLPEPASRGGLRRPDAQPYGEAIPFVSDVPVPDDLLFVLIAGSDARPGESLERSRADSIHLLAVNPASGTGTVLGFPRDAWVEIPGHGRGKINSALSLGGPDLLAATVRKVTGLPVDLWVLTGFEGITAMVDALGGVVVPVGRRMADKASGAYFERGHHQLSGREVLAFSRNRKDTAHGDFSRSANQGTVVLAALAKMRVEVGDMGGVRKWASVLFRRCRLDIGMDEAVRLGAVARRLDPDAIRNVVAPGEVGMAGSQSVVYLTEEAAALFDDLRGDATVGAAPPPTTTTSSTTSTTVVTVTPAEPAEPSEPSGPTGPTNPLTPSP